MLCLTDTLEVMTRSFTFLSLQPSAQMTSPLKAQACILVLLDNTVTAFSLPRVLAPLPNGLPAAVPSLHSSAVICSRDLFLLGNLICPCVVLGHKSSSSMVLRGQCCRSCRVVFPLWSLHCFLGSICLLVVTQFPLASLSLSSMLM